MRVTFWGTRGSIPKAGAPTVRYGGNTSCVEVISDAGARIVLDCGSGGHGLGHHLMQAGPDNCSGHMLITHAHWDHIQGLPFFGPLYVPKNEWQIYGTGGMGASIHEILAGQMQYTYFPVSVDQFFAHVNYHNVLEGSFRIEDVQVTARFLNHPALTVGYRLENNGAVVVYSTDHEPHARPLALGKTIPMAGEDLAHCRFVSDADLLIHDAQYTAAEYPQRIGWGHSTYEFVVDVAMSAHVKKLALFHHDPMRDDAALDGLVELCRARVREADESLDLFAAAEGLTVELAGDGADAPDGSPANGIVPAVPAITDESVLVAVGDEAARQNLIDAATATGLTVDQADTDDAVLAAIETARPSLVLLGDNPDGTGHLDLVRAIRRQANGAATELPVIAVSDDPELDRTAGIAAGLTDWFVAPFSTVYARTRLRTWLLRRKHRTL